MPLCAKAARNPQNCSYLKNRSAKTGQLIFFQIGQCSWIPLYLDVCKFQGNRWRSFGVGHLNSVNKLNMSWIFLLTRKIRSQRTCRDKKRRVTLFCIMLCLPYSLHDLWVLWFRDGFLATRVWRHFVCQFWHLTSHDLDIIYFLCPSEAPFSGYLVTKYPNISNILWISTCVHLKCQVTHPRFYNCHKLHRVREMTS